ATIRSYSPELMALGLSLFGMVKGITIFGTGGLVDRFSAEKVIRYVLLPVAVAISLFIMFHYNWIVLIFFILTGLTAGVVTVTVPALWAERYGPRHLGSIKSTVGLLSVLSTAAAPLVFAYGLDLGISSWLGIILVYALVSIFLAWRNSRSANRIQMPE
ncbi:MAG: MFS transporter, partial [Bacteroidota bacterium]